MAERTLSGFAALLAAQDWADLREMGCRSAFGARAQLFRQGDEGEFVHVILSGAVKVVRSEPNGGRTLLTIRGAGDVVGDWAALDGGQRFASISTLTPLACRLLTGAAFRRFVERSTVAPAYARYQITRSRAADLQRTELAVLPVRQRLARALLRLHQASTDGSAQRDIDLPQHDLADMIGASRNAVVLALGVLRAAGAIETQPRRVTVRDAAALHQLAEPGNHPG